MAQAPALHLLATSREVQNVANERVYALPQLAYPATETALGDWHVLSTYSAIHLFVDRAAAQLLSFRLTEQNARQVTQICQQLDGIPLALELAAAQLSALSLDEILTQLDARLNLARSTPSGLARQQTVRALIDWSYKLLSAVEQTLFRRLAVFAGGWTLEEAIRVTGPYADAQVTLLPAGDVAVSALAYLPVTGEMVVQALLNNLVDKSLVQARHSGAGKRYTLLETVRQYALEQLTEANEWAVISAQHYALFARLADESEAAARYSGAAARVDQLEQAHDNLRTALIWVIENERSGSLESGASLQIASALWPFWQARGYIHEGEAWLRQALTTSNTVTLPQPLQRYRARALTGLGTMAWIKGDQETAGALHREALQLYRALGDVHSIIMTLNNAANACIDLGQYTEAATLLEEALTLAREANEVRPLALLLTRLGQTDQYLGQFEQAKQHFSEALEIAQTHQLLAEQSMAQNNLADILLWLGQGEAALQNYTESLALARQADMKLLISGNLIFSALALCQAGRSSEALVNCREALTLSRAMGYAVQQVECLAVFGLTLAQQNHWELALQLLSAVAANLTAIHYAFLPVLQVPYDSGLADLLHKLPASVAEGASTRGQSLTLEQAAVLALDFRPLP